jgi:hypothetical protein
MLLICFKLHICNFSTYRKGMEVIPAEQLLEPLIVMTNGTDIAVASFPNTYERD